MARLPPMQHAKTNADTMDVWWYQEKGPQMTLVEHAHGPKFRRWEVWVYPTYRDASRRHNDWYHDAFPNRQPAINAGREHLQLFALYYEQEIK